jgi:2-methylcitrate dehydratase PrpD
MTTELAEWVASYRFSQMSAELRAMTLMVVADGTAALLAATNRNYSTGQLIAKFVRDQGGSEEATVIGQNFRTSCTNAALANGTMGYACDFEPHHPEGVLHPIAVMVPTALAIGERVGSTGAEFLAAVALGCEVEYRLSIALDPVEQYALGFHPSGVCGAFGAAAAAANLLKLDVEATHRALGLAACQASGMMSWETDPSENARPFQMGVAARNGVTAALLANDGFGGPAGVFDSGHTVFRAFSRKPKPHLLTDNLGQRLDGVMLLAIKPYPCVSFLHPGLDALLDIVSTENLHCEDISSMVLRFPRSGVHCVDGNPLKSHCAQYILPVAVADRALSVVDLFVDRRVTDAAVSDLGTRTKVVPDDDLEKSFPDRYASIIELETFDGRRFARRNDIAAGYPEHPLSPEQLKDKFLTLVGTVADSDAADRLWQMTHSLDQAASLKQYAKALGTQPVP